MGLSAYQWAMEKHERLQAGQIVQGDYYWDRETGLWKPLDAFASAGLAPPAQAPVAPPPGEGSLWPWVLAVGAVGAVGVWWWRRRK